MYFLQLHLCCRFFPRSSRRPTQAIHSFWPNKFRSTVQLFNILYHIGPTLNLMNTAMKAVPQAPGDHYITFSSREPFSGLCTHLHCKANNPAVAAFVTTSNFASTTFIV